MKVTVSKPVEIEIKYMRIAVPVRYDEEDMPNDFPFRKDDVWDIVVDIDTGKIENWPEGVENSLYMKVCDEGSYFLLDANREEVGSIINDYVPKAVPGEYGDYINFEIASDGTITNWKKKPNVSKFFKQASGDHD